MMGSRPKGSTRVNYKQEKCDAEEYDFEDDLGAYHSLPADSPPSEPRRAPCPLSSPRPVRRSRGRLDPSTRPPAGSPSKDASSHLQRHNPQEGPPLANCRRSNSMAEASTSPVRKVNGNGEGRNLLFLKTSSNESGRGQSGSTSESGRGQSGKVTNGVPVAGRRVHQAGFLKTVSIIDTLSELARDPSVQCLTDEVPRSHPRPLHPRSYSGSQIPSGADVAADNIPPRPAAPKNHSAEFHQFSEQIYGSVTAQNGGGKKMPRHRSQDFPARESGRSRLQQDATKGQHEGTSSSSESGKKEEGVSKRKVKKDKGRTPDWIKRIFSVAKTGDLAALKRHLVDMEAPLVRNLSDHNGNNLLHVMAVFGHVTALTWLVTSHTALIDALYDDNKFGLTPLLCSVKFGQLTLLQWLIENTNVRERVKSKEGERSLLHVAAKYAQEEIVAWLVDYMMGHEISLDNKDHHGNTALHLVARSGNSRVCSILLQHGADVTLKNDLGQKAWEVCSMKGHLSCAEYLCVHEAGLALATDLTRREAECETATADNHDLRINFKEVLSVARRLVKEREEVVKELSRLYDQMVESHDNMIMSLQILAEENSALRDRANGVRPTHHMRIKKSYGEQVDGVIGYVNDLHERWQGAQKSWFGSSLIDMEHRLLMVEDSWKKLRHRNHRTVATAHHPLDVFRGKLCSVRSQGGEGHLGDFPSLCSSEESITSLFSFSGDEEEIVRPSKQPQLTRKKGSPVSSVPNHSTPLHGKTIPRTPDSRTLASKMDILSPKFKGSELSEPAYVTRSEVGQWGDLEETNKKTFFGSLPKSRTAQKKWKESVSSNNNYLANSNGNHGQIGFKGDVKSQVRDKDPIDKIELNARLRELALTSESGSCSVLEVIEPSSEESDGLVDDSRLMFARKNKQEMSFSSLNRSDVTENEMTPKKGVRQLENCDEIVSTARDMSACIWNDTNAIHNDDKRHLLGCEASPVAAAVDVSETSAQRQQGEADPAPETQGKLKGFLNKFSIKPRWPSKPKGKSARKVAAEMAINDFQETYGTLRNGSKTSVETDTLTTTTDSNSSSSQKCSSFSEEISLGKAAVLPLKGTTTLSTSEVNDNVFTKTNHDDIDGAEMLTNHLMSDEPMSMSHSSGFNPRKLPEESPLSTQSSLSLHGQSSLTAESSEEPLPQVPEGITLKHGSESRSLATSDDSGFVAHPASSASKTDSRPESSSSSFLPIKREFCLQKTYSLTRALLPAVDCRSNTGRMSPAPSEVSKTESALFSPSQASELSKCGSSRHLSYGKVSMNASVSSKDGSVCDYPLTLLPLTKQLDVKTAAIVDISCEPKSKNSDTNSPTSNAKILVEVHSSETEEKKTSPKQPPPKAWYELSDEETDILLPNRLPSVTSDDETDEA